MLADNLNVVEQREKRYADDGQEYTHDDFVTSYGAENGLRKWSLATPCDHGHHALVQKPEIIYHQVDDDSGGVVYQPSPMNWIRRRRGFGAAVDHYDHPVAPSAHYDAYDHYGHPVATSSHYVHYDHYGHTVVPSTHYDSYGHSAHYDHYGHAVPTHGILATAAHRLEGGWNTFKHILSAWGRRLGKDMGLLGYGLRKIGHDVHKMSYVGHPHHMGYEHDHADFYEPHIHHDHADFYGQSLAAVGKDDQTVEAKNTEQK